MHECSRDIATTSHVSVTTITANASKNSGVLVGKKRGILNSACIGSRSAYVATTGRAKAAIGVCITTSSAITVIGDIGEETIGCIGSAAMTGMACVPTCA